MAIRLQKASGNQTCYQRFCSHGRSLGFVIRCFVVACLQVMPPKAKAKAAGKQNALQAEGWCCSGGSGANVGGPVFGTVCCSLDWLRSFLI